MQQKNKKFKAGAYGIIAAGVALLLYALIFPFYRVLHYVIGAVVAIVTGRVISIMAQGLDTSKSAPVQVVFQPTGNADVDSLIKRGQEMLAQIREENRLIPDVVLSEKIDKLEDISNRIFHTVAEQPQKAPQIRRFMEYYLPTTLKMLTGYRKMDERKVEGETAKATREQIENAMDVVLTAFNKQLATMYQDDMLDISTDIDVLETMLKQDGLIENGLHQK